jgi:SAM-dependent methyltransferase
MFRMNRPLYWLGNIAKGRVVDEILSSTASRTSITVFDYGCGHGGDWPAILSSNPQLHLIAYEPDALSCQKARERLQCYQAVILSSNEFHSFSFKADYIVSFSVFEHVFNRSEFLYHAKRILAPNGVFYLNYDDGHFRNVMDLSLPETWIPAFREILLSLVSRLPSFISRHVHYQQRVKAADVDALASQYGFVIEEVYYHNLASLKQLSKVIPVHLKQAYASWWLDTERTLNHQFASHSHEICYGDSCILWQQALSRTLCLKHVP